MKGASKEMQITLSYPSLIMRTLSKLNLRAEKYERIGSENPTVGRASIWENVALVRDNVSETTSAGPWDQP